MTDTAHARRIWVPQLVAIAMLLWALNPENPYSYYVLLRFVCCGTFAFLAARAWRGRREAWAWILGATAALYNPFLPIHLSRDIWSVINLGTVLLAVLTVVVAMPDSK